MSASDISGVCLPQELEALVLKHTQNHLLLPVDGTGIRPIDISAAFRSGRAKNDDPKVVEHFRQGVAIDVLREKPELYPFALEVLQVAERMVLHTWHSTKRHTKLVQLHHTCPPVLEGLWKPQVSRRTDLEVPSATLEAMQKLSACPFRVNSEMNDLLWKVRGSIPLGETEETRFSKQESFYPMRLRPMSLATGGLPFYIAMAVCCWAMRMYAKSAGTVHPMFDLASRAMIDKATPDRVDHIHWRMFKSWCKRHFAKNSTLREWCDRCLTNPEQALFAGAMGKPGGCERYEYRACFEFARLERCSPAQRYSAFMPEWDTAGSGPLLLKMELDIVEFLNEIDVTAKGWQHPREVLYLLILLQQMPFLTELPKAVLLKILKKIFSPKTYGSGAGPVFDVLVGTDSLRDGFSSWDSVDMAEDLAAQFKHLPVELGYHQLKLVAKSLSDAFNEAFEYLVDANTDALETFKQQHWMNRTIGGGIMMSPFRGVSDDDISAIENPDYHIGKSSVIVEATYSHPILRREKTVKTTCDRLKMDTQGTSALGRKLHRIDGKHRAATVLNFKGDCYTIHDAGAPGMGDVVSYCNADSQALMDMFPATCNRIGFTTKSRICH